MKGHWHSILYYYMAGNDKEDYCGNESISKVSNIWDAKLSFARKQFNPKKDRWKKGLGQIKWVSCWLDLTGKLLSPFWAKLVFQKKNEKGKGSKMK